jgi:hypothetical protein
MIIESVEGVHYYYDGVLAKKKREKDGVKEKEKKIESKTKNDATGGLRVLYWRG